MILSIQQKFLLARLEELGGARMDQLAALLRPAFYADRPDVVPTVVERAIRQMRVCNCPIRVEGDLCYLPRQKPSDELLEAIDVMLALTRGSAQELHREEPPLLIRFCYQEEKVRLFLVVRYRADLTYARLDRTERIIQLFDGQGVPHPLPVSNKQFCAVRQEDGTHRFFALDGQQGG